MEFKPLNKLFRPWLSDQSGVNCAVSSRFKCLDVTNRDYMPFIYNTQQYFNFYVPLVFANQVSNHSSSSQRLHLSNCHNIDDNNSLTNFIKSRNQISTYGSDPLQCIPSSSFSSIASNSEKSSALSNNKWHHKYKRQRPKRFNCPHCQIAFSNNGQLKGHIRTHTGERPFVCDHKDCGKAFTRNEELTRHRRIHTGIRPYSCVMCTKRFGRKDHMTKHLRTHSKRYYSITSNSLTLESISHTNSMSFLNSMMLLEMRH